MLRRSWILIAFVYLAFAEVLSLVPVPDTVLCLIEPEDSQQTTGHDDKQYCPAFHVGVVAAIDAVDGFLERHDKSVVGGFTVILAISTIGLWLATNKLWAAGERQIDHLSDTAERQLRAYVVVESKGFEEQDETNGKIVANMRLINTGQTPAYEMQVISMTDIFPHPIPKSFDFRIDTAGDDNPSISMLGPRSKTAHDSLAERIYSDMELIKIRSDGPWRLYCFGTVSYRDAFGERRFTNFCYYFDWGTEHIAVKISELYNDAN